MTSQKKCATRNSSRTYGTYQNTRLIITIRRIERSASLPMLDVAKFCLLFASIFILQDVLSWVTLGWRYCVFMMKGSSDKTKQNNIIWQSQMCLKNPNNNIIIKQLGHVWEMCCLKLLSKITSRLMFRCHWGDILVLNRWRKKAVMQWGGECQLKAFSWGA